MDTNTITVEYQAYGTNDKSVTVTVPADEAYRVAVALHAIPSVVQVIVWEPELAAAKAAHDADPDNKALSDRFYDLLTDMYRRLHARRLEEGL